ncbi:hypothetical protein PPYR_10689 [Photinus pyralis]|uniref:MIF4G domain-containing protein n=1 Tax=Photinus pyralis TaxID=7054 RepID=A0A5N4AHD2_PHOPY|nr:polyadenylate-binding protein-interacting protein 1 [Photinus pyralis]KAB0796628.1 hypothetical protein PPYR_10689 [Photinus pyralis]
MSDGNSSHTWEENCAKPLRRPSSVRANNTTNGNNSNGQETENRNGQRNSSELVIVQNSRLSPRAPEWYPANYKQPKRAPHQAAQDRLLHLKQHLNKKNVNTSEDEPKVEPEDGEDTECRAVEILENLMQNLIRNPAQFQDILGSFIETLAPFYMDFQFINYITELIVEKVLSDPNFRYSAVRLCVVIQSECGLFRSALCLLCQKKANRNNDFNLTLLLAELYTQLDYDTIYADLVINSLIGILKSYDENNVKAACQVLKLTGFALENTHKNEISDIFTKLFAARDHQLLAIKNLIDSVISLREQNWGRTTPSINTTHNSNQTTNVAHDGPVFYGPDGQELTEEEQQFLDNCSSHSTQSDAVTDFIDEDWWDPEMTDEIMEAFEQFIINEN